MNLKKIFLAGIVTWLVGLAFTYLTCGWLFNWVYTIPPLIWQPPEAMFSANAIIWSNLLGLAASIIFVLVYAVLYKGLPGKKGVNKGLAYGFIVWLVGGLSGVITMPFYMTIANTVVVYWIMQSLAWNIIRGIITGAMYKEK